MNYIVLVYDENCIGLANKCIGSLRAYSNCQIIEFSPGKLDMKRWVHRKMLHRYEILTELDVPIGSRVISCDVDILFQGDPFQAFSKSDDVIYTTRHYNTNVPVNGGLLGFVHSPRSKEALQFMVDQMTYPTWQPFIEFTSRMHQRNIKNKLHANDESWFKDQDLLCAIHFNLHRLPFATRFRDVGYRYNYCPESGAGIRRRDTIVEDFLNGVKNDKPVVVHFKELSYLLESDAFALC